MIWNENVKYWNQVLDAHTVWARDHTKDYLEEMESHKLNPSALTYGTLARKPTIRKKIESWGVWGVTGYHVNPCDLMLGCGASMGRCFQKATCRGISQEVSRRFAISNFGSATWGLSLCGLRWCPKCPKVVWQGIASVAGIACIALCLLSCWHLLLSQEGLHQSELRFCISIHSEYIPQPIRSNQIQSDPISVSGPRWKRQKQYCSAGRPFEGICQGTAQHTLCRSCVSFVSLAVLVNSCMCVAQALQESAGCLSLLISMLIPLGRR